MKTISLKEYAAQVKATSATKVTGPRGAFISFSHADGSKSTIPCGKRSQNGTLATYKVLCADDGGFIATVNEYKTSESMSFVGQGVKEEA
jgi:hypothetical protein